MSCILRLLAKIALALVINVYAVRPKMTSSGVSNRTSRTNLMQSYIKQHEVTVDTSRVRSLSLINLFIEDTRFDGAVLDTRTSVHISCKKKLQGAGFKALQGLYGKLIEFERGLVVVQQEDCIAAGGEGVIFKGKYLMSQPPLNKEVAVKFATDKSGQDCRFRQRLEGSFEHHLTECLAQRQVGELSVSVLTMVGGSDLSQHAFTCHDELPLVRKDFEAMVKDMLSLSSYLARMEMDHTDVQFANLMYEPGSGLNLVDLSSLEIDSHPDPDRDLRGFAEEFATCVLLLMCGTGVAGTPPKRSLCGGVDGQMTLNGCNMDLCQQLNRVGTSYLNILQEYVPQPYARLLNMDDLRTPSNCSPDPSLEARCWSSCAFIPDCSGAPAAPHGTAWSIVEKSQVVLGMSSCGIKRKRALCQLTQTFDQVLLGPSLAWTE